MESYDDEFGTGGECEILGSAVDPVCEVSQSSHYKLIVSHTTNGLVSQCK